MKNSTLIILLSSTIFLFGGVSTSFSQKSPCDGRYHLTGKFSGILPCLDCPGIETTLTLRENGTFHLTRTYIDKQIAPIEESGIIHKTDNKKKLLLVDKNHNKTYIKIQKNGLLILNRNGKPTNPKNEKEYLLLPVLTDTESILPNKLTVPKWQLTQLSHGAIESFNSSIPYIHFDTEKEQIHGFAGCNNFFGKYETENAGEIHFLQISATKKFCSESMDLETRFLEMLNNCRHFKFRKDTLILEDQNKNQLATFIPYK